MEVPIEIEKEIVTEKVTEIETVPTTTTIETVSEVTRQGGSAGAGVRHLDFGGMGSSGEVALSSSFEYMGSGRGSARDVMGQSYEVSQSSTTYGADGGRVAPGCGSSQYHGAYPTTFGDVPGIPGTGTGGMHALSMSDSSIASTDSARMGLRGGQMSASSKPIIGGDRYPA